MIRPSCASIASDLVDPSPDHRESSQLAFHQLHFGDHGGVVSLMRYLEGVLDLLGVVQATHLIIFIPAK
jgi:hypothetical protein